MEHEPPFAHPLKPRVEMTVAEKAFFREAIRRLSPLVGHPVKMEIDDRLDNDGEYIYRLVARWVNAEGSKRWVASNGQTPGEALTVLLAVAAETVKP